MNRIQVVQTLVAITVVTSASVVGAQTPLRSTAQAPRQIDVNTREYDVPVNEVWTSLLTMYRSAGIKPTSEDEDAHKLSYVANPAGAKIGNSKIEDVVDCGGDKKTPLARSTPLAATVRSQLLRKGEGTVVMTFVDVNLLPASGDSAVAAPNCASKFALEKKLWPQVSKLAFTVKR